MVETTLLRRNIANVCLNGYLATQHLPFLRRNWNLALDQHEVSTARKPVSADDQYTTGQEEMVANERRRAGWDHPTEEMLRDLLKGQEPVLTLDALKLLPCGGGTAISKAKQPPTAAADDPEWLPAAQHGFSARCQVTVCVLDTTTGSAHPSRIFIDTVAAHLQSVDAHNGKEQFEVCLDEPFTIPIGKIYVPVDSGKTENDVAWRRSMPAQYELMVEVKCLDLEASAAVLARLENKSPSDYHGRLEAKEAVLVAKWKKLPNCPAPDQVLKISRMQGLERLTDLTHGMAISMGWSRKQDSPLARFNRLQQHKRKIQQDQLPTPSASEGSDRHVPRYIVTWTFQASEERYHTVYGLSCPICNATRETAEYPSMARLQLHLMTWHDHFRPEVIEEGNANATTEVRYTVRLCPSDQPLESSPELAHGEEEGWVAPRAPFDQAAYLQHRDIWTGHKQRKPNKKTSSKRGKDLEPESANAGASAPRTMGTASSRPGAQRMQRPVDRHGRAPPQKQKYRVPTVSGVRFYRTVSKRPFEVDEEVSESDDDIDESWLTERLHDDLNSLKLAPGTQEFLEDFNRFVGTGAFAADVLTREGIVRFTQKHRLKALCQEWRDAYKDRLKLLACHRIIDKHVLKQCMKLINSKKLEDAAKDQPAQARRSQESRGGEKAKNAEDESPRDRCVCGKRADSAHGTIMCDEQSCVRLRFHMACVKLERRVDGWVCGDCKAMAT